MSERGEGASAQLQNDGTFSFGLLQPGTYDVDVFANSARNSQYVQSVLATGATAIGRSVTIESSSDVRLTVTMGEGLGEVTGVARLNATPEPGAMVLLVPESGQINDDNFRMDQSDSDGTFALRSIVPGKYILMAIDDAWELDWKDPSVLKPYRDKGQLIQVAPGQPQKVTINVVRRIDAQQPTN
jgi:hypothetical protein